MAIITSYPNNPAVEDNDRVLTSDQDGSTNLTSMDQIKDYTLAPGNVGTSTLADSAVTAAKINFASLPGSALFTSGGVGWEKIGETILGSSGTTITVSSLPARKYLHAVISVIATGGTNTCNLRFNGDTASNYSLNAMDNGGASSGIGSQSNIGLSQNLGLQHHGTLDIINIAASEKISLGRVAVVTVAGASGSPSVRDTIGKWANTSNQISSITITQLSGGTGSYAIGSSITVWGRD